MKYKEKDLVKLKRDPHSIGVIVARHPGIGNLGVVSGNHYQVYWSAGSEDVFDIDETWHTEEELTPANNKASKV